MNARTTQPSPWLLDLGQILDDFTSDVSRGLSTNGAESRLREHGPNELDAGESVSAWRLLLGQFTNTMIVVLAIAGLVTFVIGERVDSVVILAIVVLNATVGFIQEFRAERAMEALHEMTTTQATVVRDGVVRSIPAPQVVPGDVVVMTTGDVVPADLRLAEVHELRMDEAPLTGESEPVAKTTPALLADTTASVGDRTNMAFKGTAVARGRGRGVVIATGMNTEIGRIAAMLSGQAARSTPLQRRLASLGRRMAAAAAVVCAVVFATGVARGEPVEEMFITAVSLAVAAIPEGLPAVVTVALALGARRMAAQRALVRRLPAVETLGSVTVICTDKTGTLTQNRMAVEQVWTLAGQYALHGVGYEPTGELVGPPIALDEDLQRLALVAAVCNDARLLPPAEAGAWALVGDPTEGALLAMAGRLGVDVRTDVASTPRFAEVPFDSTRRRMSTVHQDGDRRWMATKGALDAVIPLLRAEDRGAAELASIAADALTADGYRVLALTERDLPPLSDGEHTEVSVDDEHDLRLLGIVGIADPPRSEVAGAVRCCHEAGIATVMITGDHPNTAVAIGRRLGLVHDTDDQVLTGAQLDALDDDDLAARVERIRVYARTTPEQKLRIVAAWRALGATVAMTGDGVNDAPALRSADIGVAMGITGSDVSKEAADLILADDNFATIVGAVGEGRRIYDNIRRFVRYLLTTNSGEVLLMLTAPMFGLPVPLTAPQILWVNLVTDGLPAVALGLEPVEDDAMRRRPRPPQESILGRGLWQHALWVGVLMASIAIVLQAVSRSLDWPWPTMVFTTVALLQLGHALAVRSERQSVFHIGFFSNPWLLGAVGLSVLLQFATVYVPFLHDAFDTVALSPIQLLVVIVVSTSAFGAVELEKWVRRRPDRRSDRA